ncbi:tat pathway signal sequence, partial [Pyrenochaeta sp. DS3sAY3a]
LLRSSPSLEVDQAWEALTNIGIFSISASEVRRLGKNPHESVKAPLEWGSEAYLAQSAGQHALHCLNAVRKYAYREYYYPSINTSHGGDTSLLSAIDQAHLSHCLHILLQELTCTPSMNVITHNWVETQDFPFPDFAINKKCVDHKQLLQWESRNSLSDEQWKEMARRGPALGEIIKPMPDQLLK